MTKIILPPMSRKPDGSAHPYPIQISLQAQEFIQGALFRTSFAETAAGEFVKLPEGINRVKQVMCKKVISKDVYEDGWRIMTKYQAIFIDTSWQSVLITLNSHWDWYARKLSEFIRFARSTCGFKALLKEVEQQLKKVDRLSLYDQIKIIELAIEVPLSFTPDERQELQEMSLVRNLGLHNRWEIDSVYLKKTKRTGFEVNELYPFHMEELENWLSLLNKLLRISGLACAKQFRDAPDFPI